MIELDRSEAIRYMGYHGTQPDEAVQASLTRCGEALQQAAEPKSIFRVFPLQHIDAQTLEIAAAAAVIGIVLGFLLALCRIKKFPVLSQFATLYISFMRGTPLLVQLFLSYYGRPAARPCAASFCRRQ